MTTSATKQPPARDPKLSALIEFLKGMGCQVKELSTHVSIKFDVDSPHLEHLRQFIWKFCREERLEWYSESRAGGDICF